MSIPDNAAKSSPRADWMRVLALAKTDELGAAMGRLNEQGHLPAYDWLRRPETGMTMVQGRSGGTGARFNLGEMTVTRCALKLRADAASPAGIAYIQGRSAQHAGHAALADALLQTSEWQERVLDIVITPLRDAHAARIAHRAQAVAATRVDFFTMDRGENPND